MQRVVGFENWSDVISTTRALFVVQYQLGCQCTNIQCKIANMINKNMTWKSRRMRTPKPDWGDLVRRSAKLLRVSDISFFNINNCLFTSLFCANTIATVSSCRSLSSSYISATASAPCRTRPGRSL